MSSFQQNTLNNYNKFNSAVFEGAKENILFIAHRIPFPPNKGDKIRSFHELQFFSSFYNIDLVCFCDSPGDVIYVEKLKQYCRTVTYFPLKRYTSLFRGLISFLKGRSISIGCYKDRKVDAAIEILIKNNHYKFVLCYSSQVAQYAHNIDSPKVIDFIDVDSDKWKQYAEKSHFPLNFIYRTEFKRLAQYEKEIWKEFSLSVFSTKQELKLFQGKDALDKLSVMGNGVDHQFFSPQICKREKYLIFTGAMNYFPNIDAVLWFSQTIFPEILKYDPEIRFYIVGSNPTEQILKLASENIIVTGFVDDIRPYIARAAVAVYPLRIARGIQNKILEAMSMGITPVIPFSLKSSLDEEWPNDVLIYRTEKECIQQILSELKRVSPDTKPTSLLREYILKNRDWGSRLLDFHSQILALTEKTNTIDATSQFIKETV